MKQTMMVILLCGLVCLVWGSPLWAAAGTSQPSSPSHPNVFPPQGNPKPTGPISSLFRKSQAGISASMIPGAVFEAQQNPATGNVQITFRLEKPGQVEFTITDAKGQRTFAVENKASCGNQSGFVCNLSSLFHPLYHAGVYAIFQQLPHIVATDARFN